MNAFEACLKLSFGGDTQYFPGGGTGQWTRDPQEVLHMLAQLLAHDGHVLHIYATYPDADLKP